MDIRQITEIVDELSRMDFEMLGPTFLADHSLGTFGIDADVLAHLLVDLALGTQ